MADWVPGISQLKSLVQLAGGDSEGVRQTQENFSKQCPVVSQIRSTVELIKGDTKAAWETQKDFFQTVGGVIDGIPGIGHAKGVIHYACGDREGGDNAMKSASRTTGTLAGGAGGLLVAGPGGAIAGGITGAAYMDVITTGIDSAVHDEFRPAGYIHQMKNLVEDPTNSGTWFDTGFMVVGDGLTGKAGGKMAENIQNFVKKRNVRLKFEAERQPIVDQVGEAAAKDFVEAADRMKDLRNEYDIPERKPHITSVVRDLDTNEVFDGHNKQVRDFCKRSDLMIDYSSPDEPSELQRNFPVKEPLPRDAKTCAEHRAYHRYIKKHGYETVQKTRIASVRYDKPTRSIKVVSRCDNCKAYSKGMGDVPGDKINGMTVPNHPGIGKYSHYADAGKVFACCAQGALLQNSTADKGKNYTYDKKDEDHINDVSMHGGSSKMALVDTSDSDYDFEDDFFRQDEYANASVSTVALVDNSDS